MAYKYTDYKNIPNWKFIKTSILKRDAYTCQVCGRKKDTITCEEQTLLSRYVEKFKEGYLVINPHLPVNRLKSHITKDLTQKIQINHEKLSFEKMLSFPYYYHKLSEDHHINGEVLTILLSKFRTLNPIVPSHPQTFHIYPLRVKIYPYHIDKDLRNNHTTNLITLCDECYIAQES